MRSLFVNWFKIPLAGALFEIIFQLPIWFSDFFFQIDRFSCKMEIMWSCQLCLEAGNLDGSLFVNSQRSPQTQTITQDTSYITMCAYQGNLLNHSNEWPRYVVDIVKFLILSLVRFICIFSSYTEIFCVDNYWWIELLTSLSYLMYSFFLFFSDRTFPLKSFLKK